MLKSIKVDVESSDVLDFEKYFYPPEFIALETNDYSLVSDWQQVLVTDDLVFFVPSMMDPAMMGLVVFHRDGSFRNSIYNKGRGPDEYNSLVYVFIDTIKDDIIFWDQMDSKLVRMDYNGIIKEKLKVPGIAGYGICIHPVTGDYLLDISQGGLYDSDFSYTNYQLLSINHSTKKYNAFLPTPRSIKLMSSAGFSRYRDELYFKPLEWDTIYLIKDDRTVPKYVFDFGSHSKPSGFYKWTEEELTNQVSSLKGLVRNHRFFLETDDFILSIHYLFRTSTIVNFLSKSSWTSETFDSYINRFAGQNSVIPLDEGPLPFSSVGDNLIIVYEPVDLLRNYRRIKSELTPEDLSAYHQSYPGFSKLVSNLKETDNPIIALYRPRPIEGGNEK